VTDMSVAMVTHDIEQWNSNMDVRLYTEHGTAYQ